MRGATGSGGPYAAQDTAPWPGGLIGAAAIGRQGGPGDLSAIAGFFAGGIMGGGIGSLIGAIVAPERWRRFPLSGLMR